MAACCSRQQLLLAALLLCASTTLSTVAGEHHDTAAPVYKILTIIPLGGSSHTFELVTMAGSLAKRHSVTVVTPTKDLDHTAGAIRRLGDRAGPMNIQTVDDLLPLQEFAKSAGHVGRGSFFKMMTTFAKIPTMLSERCERIVANDTLLQDWRSYDMILTFGFPPPGVDSCACLLSHVLDIPQMHMRDMVLMDTPINVPQFGSGLTRAEVQGTWLGAIKNAGYWVINQGLQRVLALAEVRAFRKLRAKLGLPLSGGEEGRTCKPWVEAISGSWLFEEPHPIDPTKVMVGPMSAYPAHPLSDPAVAAFADSAESDGLVLVSFGSVASFFGQSLNLEDYTALALAFADLAPVKVLWLLPPKALPEGVSVGSLPTGPNTLVVPWASVNDVLGHPACRAFVTHGGLKSVYEATFHGVPIVGVPFMLEQAQNAKRCAARGFGVVSPEAPALRKDGRRYTREGVAALIRQVLAPSYAAAAHQIGEAMRLAYSHKRPVDRAAEEVELAMVHGGYSIQHSLARATLREAKHTEHPVTPPDVEVVAVAEGGKEGDVYDESGELREEL